jgi:hypothetical protein
MARLQEGTLDIGLVAIPITASKEIQITHWRDRMMAFLPATWKSPAAIKPGWLMDKPMIFNDADHADVPAHHGLVCRGR